MIFRDIVPLNLFCSFSCLQGCWVCWKGCFRLWPFLARQSKRLPGFFSWCSPYNTKQRKRLSQAYFIRQMLMGKWDLLCPKSTVLCNHLIRTDRDLEQVHIRLHPRIGHHLGSSLKLYKCLEQSLRRTLTLFSSLGHLLINHKLIKQP